MVTFSQHFDSSIQNSLWYQIILCSGAFENCETKICLDLVFKISVWMAFLFFLSDLKHIPLLSLEVD